ncbi:MAG TPA: DUF2163 domain-containing protein [Dongiaceae bacterium]|nr:DUF2163 domain-containing protein [Dongiaceae bacterium]
MKATTAPMDTHLAGDLTKMTLCCQVTRRDNQVFRMTTHDQDVEYPAGSGVIYSSSFGSIPNAVDISTDYSVATQNYFGFWDDAEVSETDMIVGKFNGADVRIFLLNWSDTSATMGQIKEFRGNFGQASLTKQGFFQIELRSMMQKLQQLLGSYYSQTCQHSLGDSKCRVPIKPDDILRDTDYVLGQIVKVPDIVPAPDSSAYHDRIFTCTTPGHTDVVAPPYDYTVGNMTTDGTAVFTASEAWTRAGTVAAGTQTTAGDKHKFNVTLTEARAVDGWFAAGALTWETGNNADLPPIEVKGWTQTGAIMQLRYATPFAPQPGDKFRVYKGCNLFLSGCKGFNNVINRLGFDNIPGEIAILGYGIGDGNVSVGT